MKVSIDVQALKLLVAVSSAWLRQHGENADYCQQVAAAIKEAKKVTGEGPDEL